ncbi:hypothetical protein [Salinarchaeum sp. Harcht-Bsk1]|uniref:hypothetical protein n=1 Tax=Salinarchaeum sp. Harcht-Bsk1 TaxID=1333523 RepID=UPI001181BA67|nr:hypothetical protein [Salinarchaeum sp. Harcht-Bsk1]
MISTPPSWLQQWSEVIAGIGTVVLTIFLVLLYKRQSSQLEAQHEAVLEVTDVEWYGDNAIIWLSNFGNGVVKDLRLTTLVKSDSGSHRNHALRANALKRIGKGGEWTNIIRPGEEEIPFHGTSQIGKHAHKDWPSDWLTLKFSNYARNEKGRGATELKYTHAVMGSELSGNSSWDRINPMTESINPQDFGADNSLENLPRKTSHGMDDTFLKFFSRTSLLWDWTTYIYVKSIRGLNRIIPMISLRPRVLDASGTRRVKRVLLKRDLKYLLKENRVSQRFVGDS